MKILLIAMSDSIHTARWINQIADQGWDIHLFASRDYGITHPDLRNVTVYHSVYAESNTLDSSVRLKGEIAVSERAGINGRRALYDSNPDYRIEQLHRLIEELQPDIIHSLEIQSAGYLTLEAKKRSKDFPAWIVTNWGSDIYLFGQLSGHKEKIKEVLSACDYYSCECYRDIQLARSLGLKGQVLPVFPNTGGFDLEEIFLLRYPGKTSERRLIMLKGYQGWAGRCLVGLRALERCADILHGYEIAIYNAGPDVLIAAELFANSTGIPIKIIESGTPHREMLALHGQTRLSIGLSISDAISTSLLEAAAMGSFPIQSWTSCANEWIQNGKAGILVPPNDPDIIELAIRRALTDDDLVNEAAELNFRMAEEKLDQRLLKPMAVDFYRIVKEATK